ncbi:hypothetical protein ACWGRF_02065 [Streptomyces zhihengii]
MHTRTLARARLDGAGWAHPYPLAPWSPVVYADGGNEPDPNAAPTPPAPGTPPTPTPPAVPPTPAPPAGGHGEDINSLPAWAQKALTDARAEAGKSRTVAKQNAADQARAELVEQFAQVLGIGTEKPPTADELAAQLRDTTARSDAAEERAAAAAIELHVYRTAARLGADAEALLDSRAFCDAVDDLDPSDPAAFNTAVQAAIETALTNNPRLRARPSAGRSGGDLGGGGGSGDQAHSLDKQIAQAKADGNWREAMRLENTKLLAAEAAQQ